MELILLWLMSAFSVFCLEENSLKHYQTVHLYSPNEVLNISFIHLYDTPVTIIAVIGLFAIGISKQLCTVIWKLDPFPKVSASDTFQEECAY